MVNWGKQRTFVIDNKKMNDTTYFLYLKGTKDSKQKLRPY